MIKLENCEVVGWEHAIRGMRNPKNSWDKSDSMFDGTRHIGKFDYDNDFECKSDDESDSVFGGKFSYGLLENVPVSIGPNDHKLMMNLASGGPVHAKYRRMITVYVDITAPLYWWKEFDTYKVGTVANSCSTMHKIHAKEFELEDFSCEHLRDDKSHFIDATRTPFSALDMLKDTITVLNTYCERYLETHDKDYWWQMIQLLPTSYNQKRTVMLNYEVLVNIYESRRHHKLDEWHDFCKWIESLPYSEIITGGKEDV